MYKLTRRPGRALTSVAVLLLPGCSVLSSGFMAPAGPIAVAERHYFLIVCLVMLLVVVPVFVLTPLLAWHYRLANTKSAFRPDWGFSWILEGLIWIPPTVIVIILSVILVRGTVRLDPYRSISQVVPPLQVEAVALDWKWLFIYPEQHLASVNRLVIPAGVPVHMVLTSGTVMQSLLMPNLAGQIYAMAGMTTQLNLVTSTSGTYWGENTQFNGLGFQNDKFQVLAVDPASFTHWVSRAQLTPHRLDDATYRGLSRRSIVVRPITFGNIEPNLFRKILQLATTPLVEHNTNSHYLMGSQ